jgi:hypothetical protein
LHSSIIGEQQYVEVRSWKGRHLLEKSLTRCLSHKQGFCRWQVAGKSLEKWWRWRMVVAGEMMAPENGSRWRMVGAGDWEALETETRSLRPKETMISRFQDILPTSLFWNSLGLYLEESKFHTRFKTLTMTRRFGISSSLRAVSYMIIRSILQETHSTRSSCPRSPKSTKVMISKRSMICLSMPTSTT